jgi:cob(I)alamin adenosyltransferase
MAMSDVEEMNSGLDVLLAEPPPDDVRELLVSIQHEVFNLGGELSIPGYEWPKADAVLRLDNALEHYIATLPRLKEFILPAGRQQSRAGACQPHGGTARRTRAGRAARPREGERSAAPVSRPPERPYVRADPRAQPRQT